jgi:hypothetical protein
VLREAGLVTMRAQGQKRFYSLQPGPLGTVSAWLETFSPEQTGQAVDAARPAGQDRELSGGPAVEPAAVEPAVTQPPAEPAPAVPERPEEQAGGVLAAAALAAPGGPAPAVADTTRQQQLGRTMGRAAERAADLISQLRRRKDPER